MVPGERAFFEGCVSSPAGPFKFREQKLPKALSERERSGISHLELLLVSPSGLACSALWLCLRDAGTVLVASGGGPHGPLPHRVRAPTAVSPCSGHAVRYPACFTSTVAPRHLATHLVSGLHAACMSLSGNLNPGADASSHLCVIDAIDQSDRKGPCPRPRSMLLRDRI